MPPNSDILEAPLRHVHKPLPHDSGAKHVQGSAKYIDDIPEPIGTLHIAVGGTPVARGTLRRLDLSEVRKAPGVIAVVTAADIPGKNDISPGSADEPYRCSNQAETPEETLGRRWDLLGSFWG